MAYSNPKYYQFSFTKFQLFIVIFLAAISVFISFILGIISGKYFTSVAPSKNIIQQEQTITLKPEELNFLNNTSNKEQKEQFIFDEQYLNKLKKNTENLKKTEVNPSQVNQPQTVQQKIDLPKPKPKPIQKNLTIPTNHQENKITGNYTVQVFTSGSRDRASNLLKKLASHGFDTCLYPYLYCN